MEYSPRKRYAVLCGLILLSALARLLPHPANFTPLGALALFGGAQLKDNKLLSLAIPLIAMLISDAFIGFHGQIPFVYASLGMVVLLGYWLETSRSIIKIAGAGFLASLVFFVITNFGVWLEGSLYSRDLAGLATCYIAAIPFFGNFWLSTMIYSFALFASFAGVERLLSLPSTFPGSRV